MNAFLSQFQFNGSLAYHLGAEEEFWTVDDQGKLCPASVRVFPDPEKAEIRLSDGCVIKPELPIQQLEAVTGPCSTVRELELQIKNNRDMLENLGRRFEFSISTSPRPPIDFDVEVYPKERYLAIKREVPEKALRGGWIAGLHVHVGCKDFDQAIRIMNGLRSDLPRFLACSARGKSSQRMVSYMEMQSSLVPPHIEGVEHFAQIAEEQGFRDDPKRCWWAVRINPVGTVEVRIFDMQKTPRQAAQLAALVKIRAVLADMQPSKSDLSVEQIRRQIFYAAYYADSLGHKDWIRDTLQDHSLVSELLASCGRE